VSASGQNNSITNRNLRQGLSTGNLRIHRQSVEVIEPCGGGPARQGFLTTADKRPLEAGDGLTRVRVPARHHAALTRIAPPELDLADLKRNSLSSLGVQPILPERFDATDFDVCSETASKLVQR
jgi:hypothetical protein